MRVEHVGSKPQVFFESPAEMLAVAQAEGWATGEFNEWGKTKSRHSWMGDFYGKDGPDAVAHKILHGDEALVKSAEALLSTFSDELDFGTLRAEYHYSAAGALPCVPSFLAGSPEPMLHRVHVPTNVAPVRLFVCTTSSAMVSERYLQERGVALVALLIAITQSRPCELFVFQQGDCHQSPVVKLQTSPPNLGELAFTMSSQGFTRGLMYNFYEYHSRQRGRGMWSGQWAKEGHSLAGCKKALGATGNDFVFPPVFGTEAEDAGGWVPWVKAKLAEILEIKHQDDDNEWY